MTSKLDVGTERIGRSLANSISRRSFFGRLGAAIVVIGGGSLGLGTKPAGAEVQACCGCSTCGFSTSCGTSDCPAGTCNCGSWYICECVGSALRRYRDCCASCSGGCSCESDGRPGCYYSPPYGSCGGYTKVKCRAITCTMLAC